MPHTIDSQIVEDLLQYKSLRTIALVHPTTANGILSLTATSENTVITTGTAFGQVVRLPSATTILAGHRFQLFNSSSQQITVQDGSGAVYFVLTAGSSATVVLRTSGTVAGVWARAISSSSPFSGTAPVICNYAANAGVGRYLEFFAGNSSDGSPYLLVSPSTIIGVSLQTSANSTGAVGLFKTTDLVNPIYTAALNSAQEYLSTDLNIPLAVADKLAVRVISGSLSKPGFCLYISGN